MSKIGKDRTQYQTLSRLSEIGIQGWDTSFVVHRGTPEFRVDDLDLVLTDGINIQGLGVLYLLEEAIHKLGDYEIILHSSKGKHTMSIIGDGEEFNTLEYTTGWQAFCEGYIGFMQIKFPVFTEFEV